MIDNREDRRRKPGGSSTRASKKDDPRACFARAIARAELGRHYWGQRQDDDFAVARRKKPTKQEA